MNFNLAHWRFMSYAIVFVLTVLLLQSQWVERLELLWLDQQFRLIRLLQTQPMQPDVVIVGIDDASVAKFSQQPIALWHPHLGQFFQAMSQAKPSIVGLDIALPSNSYDTFLKQHYDKPLLLGIRALRQVSQLVLGRTVNTNGEVRPIARKVLLMAGGDHNTGYVLYHQDIDHGIRHFSAELQKDGQLLTTLVGRMSEKLGLVPKSGMINYAIGTPFPYIPFHQVLEWYEQGNVDLLKQTFEGQAVLLGSVLLFTDRHLFPVKLAAWEPNGRYLPGVLFHAQALRSVLSNRLIQPAPQMIVLILSICMLGFWWLAKWPFKSMMVWLGVNVTILLVSITALTQGWWLNIMPAVIIGIVVLGTRIIGDMVQKIRERQRLQSLFCHYVSPQIMSEILSGNLDAGLGGKRQRICVLFSDVRNFTTRSENMSPEEVITLLNRFFEKMAFAIHSHNGTIDKFMGDGIMAFFGAPKPVENLCELAFAAATAMLQGLEELNQCLQQEGIEPIKIGIALHVGDAVVGHVGAESRHDYTAIGDMVNVSARLEGLSKTVGYTLICSEQVVDDLPAERFDALGEQLLKGHTPIPVFAWAESKIVD